MTDQEIEARFANEFAALEPLYDEYFAWTPPRTPPLEPVCHLHDCALHVARPDLQPGDDPERSFRLVVWCDACGTQRRCGETHGLAAHGEMVMRERGMSETEIAAKLDHSMMQSSLCDFLRHQRIGWRLYDTSAALKWAIDALLIGGHP